MVNLSYWWVMPLLLSGGLCHQHGGSGTNQMSMGCGKIDTCASSPAYVKANMDMHNGMAIRFTADVSVDFARGMIPHHQGAVVMCEIMLNSTQHLVSRSAELETFCQHVIANQNPEVQLLRTWLQTNRPGAGTVELCNDGSMGCGDLEHHHPGPNKSWIAANHRMHVGMAINFTCDAEVDLVRGMIPHHEGAIEMCDILTTYGQPDAVLTELCVNITTAQRTEIDWQIDWLSNRSLSKNASCDAEGSSGSDGGMHHGGSGGDASASSSGSGMNHGGSGMNHGGSGMNQSDEEATATSAAARLYAAALPLMMIVWGAM